MPEKRYCAFWYPTIFHQTSQIEPIKGRPVCGVDISDNAESSFRLFLDVKETEKGNLIFETYNKAAGTNEKINAKTLVLTLEQRSNNGFSIYSYENEEVDFNHYLYKNVFYHHAKSLHHQHEVNPDSDSSLTAVAIDDKSFQPQHILEHDNIVIQNYLLQYEVLFGEIYAKEISKRNHKYDKYLKTFNIVCEEKFKKKIHDTSPDSIEDIDKFIHKFYYSVLTQLGKNGEKYKDYTPKSHSRHYYNRLIRKICRLRSEYYKMYVALLSELCGNAEMEYTYCQTLINSKYNTKIKPDIEFSPEEIMLLRDAEKSEDPTAQLVLERDKLRKTANNIRNAIQYIECVKYKCLTRADEHIRYVLDESEKVNKRSRSWAIFFGVITVLSLVVTLVSMVSQKHPIKDCKSNEERQTEVATTTP